MVYNKTNPIKMDDLVGFPLFLETPNFFPWKFLKKERKYHGRFTFEGEAGISPFSGNIMGAHLRGPGNYPLIRLMAEFRRENHLGWC